MPYINRVRLVNVAFNDAKSFFDDFRLNFSGKSATYDLENGGGKSVLLMMLLQVVLPNTSLRDDKPFKNIFLGGKDRTSHVLVEWILDEGERYNYMLTGFCARKKRSRGDNHRLDDIPFEQDLDIINEGVDYYNYVIFYDQPMQYDIYSLELVKEDRNGKMYKGYDELHGDLKKMVQRNIPTRIFDKKGEYMEFIGSHNLISTEWKIIREINSGENSIEKYFRQNKTSRRLIENLLLPIIDDTENGGSRSSTFNDEKNEHLAETLIEIRESLGRLMKDKEHLEEYNQIRNFYNRVLDTSEQMKEYFLEKEGLQKEAVKIRNLLAIDLEEVRENIALTGAELDTKLANKRRIEQERKLLDIQLLEFDKNALVAKQRSIKEQQDTLTHEANRQEDILKEAYARKEYVQYKNEKAKYLTEQKKLEIFSIDKGRTLEEYNKAGALYKAVLKKAIKDIKDQLFAKSKEIESLEEKNKQIDVEIGQTNIDIGSANARAQIKNDEIAKYDKEINNFRDYFNNHGRFDILIDQESFLKEANEKKAKLEESLTNMDTELATNMENHEKVKSKISDNESRKNDLSWELKEPEKYLDKYRQALKQVEDKCRLYATEGLAELKAKLVKALENNRKQLIQKRLEEKTTEKKIQLLDEYGFYIPNEEILALVDRIGSKCAFIQSGIEYLKTLEEYDREIILKQISILPYSVLVDHESFVRLKRGKLNISNLYSDYPIPIMDVDIIRGEEQLDFKEVMFPSVNESLILSVDAFNEYKNRLVDDLDDIRNLILTLEDKSETYNTELTQLQDFEIEFASEAVWEQQNKRNRLSEELEKCRSSIRENEALLRKLMSKKEELIRSKEALINDMGFTEELAKKAEILMKLNNANLDAERELQRIEQELELLNIGLAELTQKKNSNTSDRRGLEADIEGIKSNLWSMEKELEEVINFDDIYPDGDDAIEIDHDNAKANFKALDDKYKDRLQEEESIRATLRAHKNLMDKCAENMSIHYGITIEMMEERELSGEILTEPELDYIRSLESEVKSLRIKIDTLKKNYDDLEKKINLLEGQITAERRQLDENIEVRTSRYESRYGIKKAIEDAIQIITLYNSEIKSLEGKLETLNKNADYLSRELNAYRDFILRENISLRTDVTAQRVESYQTFSNAYYNHINRIKDWEQTWRQVKRSIQKDSEGFFIKDPVNELVELVIPDTLQSCRLLIGQLGYSIAIIDEKVDKIQEDINLLKSYQDEFVQRCIKRADSVLDILKKFPALSRIQVEGKRENMVRMDFYDFESGEKVARMENHINAIIQEVNEEGIINRTSIANKLSTKELLAQVTNMERAVVRLYKMESIREHSRYLKWENAVGSEGQSNALYFIFAVCLISYIRLLSANITTARTKKVIIADNPFGATSAVYLWEPMFNILKANDVQLIAPGHNIPRELTSQFEVNYLLNQDILSDSRIKVVVKDVRTEEDLNQMNFENLEQISYFG